MGESPDRTKSSGNGSASQLPSSNDHSPGNISKRPSSVASFRGSDFRVLLPKTIAPVLNIDIVSGDILGTLLQLAQDPIPNIRFNVAKSLEVLASTFGDGQEGRQLIRQRIAPVLEGQKNDSDADVRYFASKALQKAQTVIGGM